MRRQRVPDPNDDIGVVLFLLWVLVVGLAVVISEALGR